MRCSRFAAQLLVLAFLTHPAIADNWPMFRGPNATGVADGHKTPERWDAAKGENVRWKTPIPGLAHASPIVWGDRIFVVTAVAEGLDSPLRVGLYGAGDSADDMVEHEWKLLCLDKNTGKILWEKTATRGVPKVKRHTKATHANSTPATDGRVVVAFFGSEGLYAYSLDGELLWSKDLGILDVGPHNDLELQWGFASSPLIHGGTVYLQCDVKNSATLVALDARDGTETWRTRRDEVPGWCTPTAWNTPAGEQILANGCKHMGGYDPSTGKEIWRMSGGGGIPVPAPVVAGDLALFTSNHRPIRDEDRGQPIYAVRSSARGDITIPKESDAGEFVAWAKSGRGNYMQTPLVYQDLAYFCKDNGVAICFDLQTGDTKWQSRLGDGSTGFTASPVAADGKIYWTSEQGDIHVIAAGPEHKELAVNPLGEICMATPAISEGILYFRTRSHLVAIGGP